MTIAWSSSQIPSDRQAGGVEREDRVARDLARQVEHRPAAAADPAHRPAAGVQFFRRRAGRAPRLPSRPMVMPGGWSQTMSARRVAVAADVVDEPPLEREEGVELQRAEQVRAQCPSGRWDFGNRPGVVHRSRARVLEFTRHRRILAPVPPITQSGQGFAGRLFRSPLALALLVVGANAVKPVLIDDTAYLAFARHIAAHPLDPYGFAFFWYDKPEPAFESSRRPSCRTGSRSGCALFGETFRAPQAVALPVRVALRVGGGRSPAEIRARNRSPRSDRALAGRASGCEPDARHPGAGARPGGGGALRSRV